MSLAPQWLKDQMEALKKLPPPTLEQVQTQFMASARMRRERACCQKHREYDMVNPPIGDCYGCWVAYGDKHQTQEAYALFRQAFDKFDGLQA